MECGALRFGDFTLTSGKKSKYYIDIKKASSRPDILKRITEEFRSKWIDCTRVAGMELGAVPLIVALSLETNIPYLIIRKEKREHGTSKQIEGEDARGKRVLVIEDVTTSGGTVVKSIQILRENKAIVDEVIVVVDRETGAEEKIRNLDIAFIPLLSVSDILKR